MIYITLFLTFLKIGLFTIGGGYAMIPLIQEEMLKNAWIESADIVNFIAVSESTPGPFAINIATYVGSEMGGIFGAFCATLGVVTPSFVIILLVAKFFEKFKTNKIVSGCMSGLKPAVIGLIASAVLSIGKTAFFPDGVMLSVFTDVKTYVSLAIFAVATVMAFRKVHPIWIICLSAAAGIAAGFIIGG
ncbi:MAG: chromate transporter [Clostridia bacterium]|nr:chromate transporter [Clostridia bacterium]